MTSWTGLVASFREIAEKNQDLKKDRRQKAREKEGD